MYVNGPGLPITSTVIVTVSPLRYWLLSNVRTRVMPAREVTVNVSVAKPVTALFATPSARTRYWVPSAIVAFSWNTCRRFPWMSVTRFRAPYCGTWSPVVWSATAMSTSTFAAPGSFQFGAKSVFFAAMSTVTIPPGW